MGNFFYKWSHRLVPCVRRFSGISCCALASCSWTCNAWPFMWIQLTKCHFYSFFSDYVLDSPDLFDSVSLTVFYCLFNWTCLNVFQFISPLPACFTESASICLIIFPIFSYDQLRSKWLHILPCMTGLYPFGLKSCLLIWPTLWVRVVVIFSLKYYQLWVNEIRVLGVIFGMTYFEFNYLDSCSILHDLWCKCVLLYKEIKLAM